MKFTEMPEDLTLPAGIIKLAYWEDPAMEFLIHILRDFFFNTVDG